MVDALAPSAKWTSIGVGEQSAEVAFICVEAVFVRQPEKHPTFVWSIVLPDRRGQLVLRHRSPDCLIGPVGGKGFALMPVYSMSGTCIFKFTESIIIRKLATSHSAAWDSLVVRSRFKSVEAKTLATEADCLLEWVYRAGNCWAKVVVVLGSQRSDQNTVVAPLPIVTEVMERKKLKPLRMSFQTVVAEL